MTNTTTEQAVHYLTLQEIQAAELEILLAFDKVCHEQGLRYSLAGGTLLGAIRHKGFIPWDDDIDVAMPRPDYEKLRVLAPHIFASTRYELVGHPGKGVRDPVFSKLVDTSIVVKDAYRDGFTNLWVDIFPIDGLPANEEEIRYIYKKANRLRKLTSMSYADTAAGTTPLRKAVKNAFRPFDKVFSIGKRAEKALSELAKAYPYEGSEHVGSIAWGIYGAREKMPAHAYSEFVEVEFEDETFPVLACWEHYLTSLYGDYLQLPPEAERVAHEMTVWRFGEAEKEGE